MLVLTYGTLKRGHGNHYLLEESEFINEIDLTGNYTMFSILNQTKEGLFKRFPILLNTPDFENTIKAELYRVTQETLDRLDVLEGVSSGMYTREVIEIDGENTFIYIYTGETRGMLLFAENEF